MLKKTDLGFADAVLPEMKKTNAGKLSDEELDRIGAGKRETLDTICQVCGHNVVIWNNAIGCWVCAACNNVWT